MLYLRNVSKLLNVQIKSAPDTKVCFQARPHVLQSLHECIQCSLVSLSVCAYRCLQCRTRRCTDIVLHFPIYYYISDILETEDLLGFKRCDQIQFSCHLCLIEKNIIAPVDFVSKKEVG